MLRRALRPRPSSTTSRSSARLWARVPAVQQAALQGVLENDPRPSYQHDPQRVYGMEFAGLEVHFKVDGDTLTVTDISRR